MWSAFSAMFCLTLIALTVLTPINGFWPPEQIHINLGLTPDEMVFNWLTWDYPPSTETIVRIGLSSSSSDLTMNTTGESYLFTDCGIEHINRTIHVAKISNLQASTRYYYQVGDIFNGWSTIYSFKTMPDDKTLKDNLPLKFIIYGDMGTTNTQACAPVTEDALNDDVDVIIHAGDMAYNMFENNGTTGDEFMNDIQNIATKVPYMVAHGNHEQTYNFSHYTQRFRGMPNNGNPSYVYTQSGKLPNNWYYSYNIGYIHFISLSSEIYFTFPWMINDQYNWLINDLSDANKNRTNAPWIIVYHHRLLYCSATGSECDSQPYTLRNGVKINSTYKFGLEDIYYKYGVDFVINGHVHNYERMYDIYKNKTTKSTKNMPSTTYLANGDAGNREGHHDFNKNQPVWSAYRTTSYSYMKFNVYNGTHIHLKQICADSELPIDQQGTVLDEVWFIQEKHGPFDENDYINKTIYDVNDNDEINDKDHVTYDPYKLYGIKTKWVKPNKEDSKIMPYISDNKDDYKDVEYTYL